MGLLSFLGITANRDENRAKDRLEALSQGETARRKKADYQADTARNRYVEGLNAFDPTEYARSTAGAIGEGLQEDLTGTLAASNQQLNARGFYGGGLNTAKITRDFNDRLARALAALSMDAAGLELSRLGGYGDLYGTDASRADQTRQSELDLAFDRFAMERDDRSRRFGGLVHLAGAGIRAAGG